MEWHERLMKTFQPGEVSEEFHTPLSVQVGRLPTAYRVVGIEMVTTESGSQLISVGNVLEWSRHDAVTLSREVVR